MKEIIFITLIINLMISNLYILISWIYLLLITWYAFYSTYINKDTKEPFFQKSNFTDTSFYLLNLYLVSSLICWISTIIFYFS